MLARRTLIALLIATPAWADIDVAGAGPFIQRAGTELAQLIAGTPDKAARRERMLPFLERVADLDGLARFCLGRYWRQATAEQQAEYLRLFRQQLASGVVDRMGEATGGVAKVVTGRPELRDDLIQVPTTVERPGNKPNRVVWVVSPEGGGYRIVDVVAEGISLRLTKRSDFAAFLTQKGGDVGALILALRNQTVP